MAQEIAEFIVVGAGTTGCLIANRLSADPANRVILLEAGGDDRVFHNPRRLWTNLNIAIPAGFAFNLANPAVSWGYRSEPIPGLDGRRLDLPRGKVVGGSSAINGMVYVRSLPTDFDIWQQMGCRGWGWEDLLPLICGLEDLSVEPGPWQGKGGPLGIEVVPERGPVIDGVLDACVQAGFPLVDTVNGPTSEGVCYTQQTTRKGHRESSATAFLHPVAARSNLRIEKNANATRILFEGHRAVGIEFAQNGRLRQVRATREVIISAGAINSPKLLELSGIGSAARLQELGITPLVNSPNVGENLQDHVAVRCYYRLKPGLPSFNSRASGIGLVREILRYAVKGDGLLGSAAMVLTGYVRSRPELDIPDLQIFASPSSVDLAATAAAGRIVLERDPGLTLSVMTMRPESRGSTHVVSRDLAQAPQIDLNFLSDAVDQAKAVDAMRLMRHLSRQPALASLIDHELSPGSAVSDDDASLLAYARKVSNTAHHLSGTCAMGANANDVLDPELRVRGVDGLRVADASIMPRVPSANINAACLMVGAKAAEIILAA